MFVWRFWIFLWLGLSFATLGHARDHVPMAGGIDCLREQYDPSVPSSGSFLTLPFYQPSVDSYTIDEVVTDTPIPISNSFTLHDSWRTPSGSPVIPIKHWRMSEYTGLAMDDLEGGQRGHIDLYAKSGEQIIGRQAGWWMNTQNDDTVLANGSLSTNLGCWYQGPPYARLFANLSQVLDVSFDTGVHYVTASGGAHSQAYFQLIVSDTSGGCGQNCAFSISVGYFGPDKDGATRQLTIPDDTGTTNLPLTGAGLDAPDWVTRMPDSIHFQVGTFSPDHVHFRISPDQLIMMRNDVAGTFDVYRQLSTNPLDYAITLINVNGEVYDPCKAGVPTCTGSSPSQLGMTVGNLRATATVPHEAVGTPSAMGGPSPLLVFRHPAGDLFGLSTDLGPSGPWRGSIGTQRTVDDPAATVGQGAQRVYFLDAGHHINETFRAGGAWQTWDMTTGLSLPDAFTPPHAYTASDGSVRMYFRDVVGHVHEVRLGSSGWIASDLTALAGAENLPPAIGSAVGYQAGNADRVVYRGVGNQLVELFFWDGRWQAWNMTTTPGAVPAATDPRAFTDPQGAARVLYRDINGALHQLRTETTGWQDTNLTSVVGAVPALGSPMGLGVGSGMDVFYEGIDHHLHVLAWSDGRWSQQDMNALDGAVPIVSDPIGYVGADGVARIDYLGSDNQLHEYFRQGNWKHRDF
ncbi:hypothetical protein [Luteibacter sp. UNCMF366Tsu5.1]|uniref:hypothetical protein n=1 Tax=Luteibacter sp. UNCMF366Tsu5.1 TaxID=1502758 RepID=UPI000909098C|nr:hypothetical protein [Luteibacter sp. UNCMF366Tsu5.1]SFW68915.1 hypothetical protein SAMN02800691_2972 [Luteibacter sp. UNCMF366Tsu5.1]